jgi:hypothetical protein
MTEKLNSRNTKLNVGFEGFGATECHDVSGIQLCRQTHFMLTWSVALEDYIVQCSYVQC